VAGLLLLAMLVNVAVPPLAQAQSAAILRWAEVYTPGKRGEVIVSPSEVSRIAVGRGDIIYAIDSEYDNVYRSDNGGLTWTEITRGLQNAGAGLPAREIAVAPDRPQNVAVVTNNRTKVYVSTDSGASWHDTNVTGLDTNEEIQCITISKMYGKGSGSDLGWDIAIGTKDGTGTGNVYVLKAPGFGGWADQSLPIVVKAVMALKFSPTYDTDNTIVVVYSNGGGTYLNAGIHDLSANTTDWTAIYTSPIEVTTAAGTSPKAGEIIAANLELPSDFSGQFSTLRRAYVSMDASNGNTGVFRIDDTTVYQLMDTTGLTKRISSIAYFGTYASGKLLAGEVKAVGLTVPVWRSLNPNEPSPAWYSASQPPSGPGNAQVAWSYGGRMAFCGTGQSPGHEEDESAFSRSVDNGDTWEQTSLIDTVINISDIAPAPDSKSLFLATYSDFGVEGVWRSAGEPLGNFWGRILTMNTTLDRLILRLSPDYITDYTIYAIELGGYQMAVSHNRGNSWQQRYIPGPVIDVAIEDKDTLYVALPGGYIRKNTNAGAAWISPAVSYFPDSPAEINMLTVVDKGHILVGSRDSRVAYSVDGGSSFIEITPAVGNSYSDVGDVQVVADANYGENGIIYASDNITDKGIWRWAISLSTEWEQIDESVTRLGKKQCISGLITGDEGTLYTLRAEEVDGRGAGGMTRSLNPGEPYIWHVEFDIVNATLPVGTVFDPMRIFPNTLPHLKLSGGAAQNELWAVDTANDIIYRFQDNLCKVGPVTMAPREIGCDPVSGRAQEVNLCWEQLSLADAYDIEVAKDRDFSIRIIDWADEDAITGFLIPASVTSPCAYLPAGGRVAEWAGSAIARWGNLECGHTYYWRVKIRHAATTEVIRSPWSEVRSFAVKAGLPVGAEYYGPTLLSPDNGCLGCAVKPASFSWTPYKETTKYRFVLAKDAAMTQVVVQATVATTAYKYGDTLDYGTNYFWRVMALEPVPSDWSATFSFQTEAAPALPTLPAEPPATPLWVLVVISIGAILVIVALILLFKTR
jgi:hypothetical protein